MRKEEETMSDEAADRGAHLRHVLEAKTRLAEQLKRYPNVTGVGVGLREVGGKRTDEIAIRVYVREKRSEAGLRPDERLPDQIDGVRVDIVEARFSTLANGAAMPIEEHRRLRDP